MNRIAVLLLLSVAALAQDSNAPEVRKNDVATIDGIMRAY